MGRKRIEIDWNKVDSMLRVMESGQSIAYALRISDETLYNAVKREKGMLFDEYARSLKSHTLYSLKAAQFKEAYGYEYTLTEEEAVLSPDGKKKVTKVKTKRVKQAPSVVMLIHLGKVYLNQNVDSGGKGGGNDGEIPGWDIVGDEEDEASE